MSCSVDSGQPLSSATSLSTQWAHEQSGVRVLAGVSDPTSGN